MCEKSYERQARINAKIDKITQVSQPTKSTANANTNTNTAYIKINNNDIFKDMYFIVVFDYINKQSNNKYKDTNLISV